MDLIRWKTFLDWAHERKYAVNLYRPKKQWAFGCDYRIQLRIKQGPTLEAKEDTLDGAISSIKEQLLSMKTGNK